MNLMFRSLAMNLQSYIKNNIPVFTANKLSIIEDPSGIVKVTGRYQDHYNHKKTVFGGTISTSLMISGWCQAMLIVSRHFNTPYGESAGFVVKHQEVDYLRPVRTDFEACSILPAEDDIQRFFSELETAGKGRLILCSSMFECGGTEVKARFSGEFVAFADI